MQRVRAGRCARTRASRGGARASRRSPPRASHTPSVASPPTVTSMPVTYSSGLRSSSAPTRARATSPSQPTAISSPRPDHQLHQGADRAAPAQEPAGQAGAVGVRDQDPAQQVRRDRGGRDQPQQLGDRDRPVQAQDDLPAEGGHGRQQRGYDQHPHQQRVHLPELGEPAGDPTEQAGAGAAQAGEPAGPCWGSSMHRVHTDIPPHRPGQAYPGRTRRKPGDPDRGIPGRPTRRGQWRGGDAATTGPGTPGWCVRRGGRRARRLGAGGACRVHPRRAGRRDRAGRLPAAVAAGPGRRARPGRPTPLPVAAAGVRAAGHWCDRPGAGSCPGVDRGGRRRRRGAGVVGPGPRG